MNRRDFLKRALQGAGGVLLLGALGRVLTKATSSKVVYQIDPVKCTLCGKCSTDCVLPFTAVKSVNDFEKCGYCEYCYGYFSDHPSSAASHKICPTGALQRRRVGEFQHEYTVDTTRCIGCGKCVMRCKKHGNGSLSLQISRSRCLECNNCTIENVCPSHAIKSIIVKS